MILQWGRLFDPTTATDDQMREFVGLPPRHRLYRAFNGTWRAERDGATFTVTFLLPGTNIVDTLTVGEDGSVEVLRGSEHRVTDLRHAVGLYPAMAPIFIEATQWLVTRDS